MVHTGIDFISFLDFFVSVIIQNLSLFIVQIIIVKKNILEREVWQFCMIVIFYH